MCDNATILVRYDQEGHTELELAGEVNVFCASQLHEEALRLADHGQEVLVCGEQLTGVDLSAVQVLWALKQALVRQGRALRFRGLAPEVQAAFALAGWDCLETTPAFENSAPTAAPIAT